MASTNDTTAMTPGETQVAQRVLEVLAANENTRIRIQNLMRVNTKAAGLMASQELLAIPIVKASLSPMNDDQIANVLKAVLKGLRE